MAGPLVTPPRAGELARFVPDRGKMLVMAAGLVVFAVLAGWALAAMAAEPETPEGTEIMRAALWAVAVLCPVYAAEIAVRVARGTPTLAATEEGVVMRSLFGASAALRWEEIAGIAPVEMGRKPWLALYLHDPVPTLARLGLGARVVLAKSHAEGVPNFAFRSIQLGTSPEEAAEILEGIRERRETGKKRGDRRRR